MNRGNLVVKWVGPVCWTLLSGWGTFWTVRGFDLDTSSDLCVRKNLKFFVQVKCVKNYPKWWQATPNSIHQLAIMVLLQVAIDKITKILVAMSNAKKEIDQKIYLRFAKIVFTGFTQIQLIESWELEVQVLKTWRWKNIFNMLLHNEPELLHFENLKNSCDHIKT